MTHPSQNPPTMFDVIIRMKRELNFHQEKITDCQTELAKARHQVENMQFQLDVLAGITGVTQLPAVDVRGSGEHAAITGTDM